MKDQIGLAERALEQVLLTRFRPRQMSAFVTVYEERNILKAAQLLSLTQSTVSKSISEMEKNLNQPLFVRSPRGVSPTPAAEVLYTHSKIILNELRRTADELQQISIADKGHVVVGVVPLSLTVLAKAVSSFKRDKPNISVEVRHALDDDLMTGLTLGEVDFVFGRLYEENKRTGLVHEPLFDDPSKVIVAESHRLAKKRTVDLVDLIDDPWILPPSNAYIRRYHDLAFLDAGLTIPQNRIETSSLSVYRQLLLTIPNAATILSEHTLDEALDRGAYKILPIQISTHANPIGITLRRDDPLHPSAQAFKDCLVAEAPR